MNELLGKIGDEMKEPISVLVGCHKNHLKTSLLSLENRNFYPNFQGVLNQKKYF